jgi:hypothetical protein
MHNYQFPIALTVLLATVVFAAEPTEAQLSAKKVELMESTKIAARMGLEGSAADFKSDGDPDTLEIVFLDKKKDGPSRVSDDGEVIFLYKASDKKQSELIDQAFTIRARIRLGI